MKLFGTIAWFCVSSVVSALVHAWAMTKIWSWFVMAEYGTGPSMGAWFGISAILTLIISAATSTLQTKTDSGKNYFADMIISSISRWLGCFVMLFIVRGTGSVLGWVH